MITADAAIGGAGGIFLFDLAHIVNFGLYDANVFMHIFCQLV